MVTFPKGVPTALLTNSSLPTAPPAYYLPDEVTTPNGVGVPSGCTRWQLQIDQTNIPADQQYGFHIEFQRLAAWVDKAGVVHPAGEWLHDAGSDTFQGGQIMLRGGGSTFIATIGSTIGATDSNGQMVEPYPDNVRAQVTKMGAWVFPSIKLLLV